MIKFLLIFQVFHIKVNRPSNSDNIATVQNKSVRANLAAFESSQVPGISREDIKGNEQTDILSIGD